ncbi:ABC transporter substrate-binding protein [Erythrobacter sp. HKB08]|uniref:ABC transporter substrate-binding protein n=1 Tax=Erythrobacter sp. HKB08 TaxID=2502843 RepID=UPI0010093CE4|nr:ABC transporter substrate-binding protein [Erythrobacter sp. HKB08]
MTLAGCAAPEAREPANHERPTIVSLNPCTDAVLAEIAEPSQLLAISHYSHDPAASSMDAAKARRFRSTGGTVEEVLALDPDVVVAGSFLPPATRAAFEDLGVRVETFGMAASVDESIAQVERLGAIAGKEQAAQQLAGSIASAAQPDQSGDRLSAVLWQPGGIVPGETTLVSDLMRRAGLTSHSAASGLGQADYLSLEALLADPPEVLLVAGRERSQAHPSLAALSDMRTERFDASLLYCGGPTIIRAMERLRAIRRQAA